MDIVIEFNDEQIDEAVMKVLDAKFEVAFIKTIEHLYAKIFETCPSISVRSTMRYDFNKTKPFQYEGTIGWPDGSEVAMIAAYTEYGTGERGSRTFKQFYTETKPSFMIPIVPKRAKAMHWINKAGVHIFAKTTKGQPAQAWIRQSIKDAEPDIEKIWQNEFSSG